MFRKTLKTLSVICAGAAMMAAMPAHAAVYILFWIDQTVVGAQVYNDYGQYCGMWGQQTSIYTVVYIPSGYGIGCP